MSVNILSKNDLNLKESYLESVDPDEPFAFTKPDWDLIIKDLEDRFGFTVDEFTTNFRRRVEALFEKLNERGATDLENNPGFVTAQYLQFVKERLEQFFERIMDAEGCNRKPYNTCINDVLRTLCGRCCKPENWTEEEVQQVLEAIATIRRNTKEQKEHWAPFIESQNPPAFPPYFEIRPNQNGCGSSYIVFDGDMIPRYVLKVVDEDIFCLNNRKGFASYELGNLVREGIPVYRSAQTDALAYETAVILGIDSITPKTWMGIYSSQEFYDITDRLRPEEYEHFVEVTGEPSKEKLCSVQEFIHGAKDLAEVYYDYQAEGKPFILDPEDFEEVHLLLWTTFDTDAHFYNLMVYPKSTDAEGNIIWGIKKVDNGLCYPEANVFFRNMLQFFPEAQRPISDSLREKILNFPLEQLCKTIRKYEMDAVIPALQERITLIQDNMNKLVTIADVNQLLMELPEELYVTLENS